MTKLLYIAGALAAAQASCGSSPKPVDVVTDGGVISPGDYDDPLEHLQRLDTSSFVEIAEVRARDDGTVLFCSGVKGLNIVDATDPAHMKLAGRLLSRLGSARYPRCQHVAWAGDLVYMSNRGDEIQPTPFVAAFDLADGGREVANLAIDGVSFEGIDAAGAFVYVAMHDAGLGVLERVDDQLVRRGTATGLRNAWGVDVEGDRAYVADGVGGLAIVDVSAAARPVVLGAVELGGAAQSVDVDGRYAYVATGQGGVAVVDVSASDAPTVVATIDTPGTALQVAVSAGRAFVADWNDVRVYDVSNPAAPALLAVERIDVSGDFPRVLGIGARGDVAFAGEWTGLHSLRLHPERAAPAIWLADRQLDFGVVAPGQAGAIALVVENQGRERLVVWKISTTGGAFETDRTQLVVEPGQLAVLEVTFRPSSNDQASAQLELWSDDPDDGKRSLQLVGNRPGVGVGDPAPEVVVQLLDGGAWRLSEQRDDVVLLAYFATF